MLMSRNMGLPDRAVRLILGIALLGLYGAIDPPFRYVTLLGLVVIATALTGVCPLYGFLGISTRRTRPEQPGAAAKPESDEPPAEPATRVDDQERSAAWWRAHHPSPDDVTWPPKPAGKWRPAEPEDPDGT